MSQPISVKKSKLKSRWRVGSEQPLPRMDICHKLLTYAREGNLIEFQRVYEHKIQKEGSVDWTKIVHEKSKDSVAHVAAKFGHVEILKYLKEKCAIEWFEQENTDGKRPLHEAAQYSHGNCVSYLIETNCNIDSLKRADWTPLMLACTKSNLEVIKLLVENDANPNLKNKDGWTCFQIACREGIVDIVKYLLSKDSQIWQSLSNNHRTPLHTAALHGRFEVVRLLLEKVDYLPDQVDSCGSTPIMDALRSGHIEVAEKIMNHHKVDLHRRDANGRQVIHLAAEAGEVASLEFLICNQNINVDEKTLAGNTSLHIACREDHLDTIKYLLNHNADVSLTDSKGRNAVYFLSRHQELLTELNLLPT